MTDEGMREMRLPERLEIPLTVKTSEGDVREIERLVFVRERTCHIECFDDGVDEGMDGEWFSYAPPTWYLSCGHKVEGQEKPNYCSNCGARVLGGD